MIQGTTQPERRKRASKPKVRTGCITCKIRHVKCDEGKPECLRCTSTGRKCDGYEANPNVRKTKTEGVSTLESISPVSSSDSPSSSAPQNPPRQLQLLAGSVIERRALELFLQMAVPEIDGPFTRRFWNSLVLQMSHSEVSVRHALVAVSTMFENSFLIGKSSCAGSTSHVELGLVAYNRAIKGLITLAKAKTDSVAIAATICALFVCVEFLRRDFGAAFNHMDGGIKMLQLWRDQQRRKSPGRLPNDPETLMVDDVLVPLFASLNAFSMSFGRPYTELHCNPALDMDDSSPFELFRSMEEASKSFTDLLTQTLKIARMVGAERYTGKSVDREVIVQRDKLLSNFAKWRKALTLFENNNSLTWGGKETRHIQLLKMWYLSYKIWLPVCESAEEIVWDGFKSEYEEIVMLGGSYLDDDIMPSDEASEKFSFEMGVIPALHFVAWKCRWPLIRRRALYLLYSSPRQESLYTSHASYAVYSRVMEIEEEALNLAPGQLPAEDELPPEEARVHQVDIPTGPVSGSIRPIKMLRKLNGLQGDWDVREEFVDMGVAVEVNESVGKISTYPWLEVAPGESYCTETNALADTSFAGTGDTAADPLELRSYSANLVLPLSMTSEGLASTAIWGLEEDSGC